MRRCPLYLLQLQMRRPPHWNLVHQYWKSWLSMGVKAGRFISSCVQSAGMRRHFVSQSIGAYPQRNHMILCVEGLDSYLACPSCIWRFERELDSPASSSTYSPVLIEDCSIPSSCWYKEPGAQWWQYYAVCPCVQVTGTFGTEVQL